MSSPLKRKVIRLFSGAGPVIDPDKDIIKELAELLAQAKRGEVKGIGYFLVDGGNAVTTGWYSGCADRHDMTSGAAMLAFRVTMAAVEG